MFSISQKDVKDFIPGFAMGMTRSIISHPFEIYKIKSQLSVTHKISMFEGIQYSVLASGFERGIQFFPCFLQGGYRGLCPL